MSDNREIAIKLNNVKKMYKLGQIGGGTFTADVRAWWAKKRGKEDPNVKIGQEERARLVGQTFMALNGIDLTIYKGEAVGIIGSNGAGKSTMLKLLSRVTAPTSGEIDIYGRITSMLEVGTGFNGEMTGRENVYLNGAILGMTKAEIDAKMEDIIEFSEVRDFIDTPVKRYSSGMFVKLAFSVAAHLDSEIMIMDEVLAVGDMAFQTKCLGKMRDVAKKEGRTVLYVSHNMNTIRQLCDRCIVLDKGKVIFDGDVERAISIYLGNKIEEESIKYFNESDLEKWCNYKVFFKSAEILNPLFSIYCGDLLKLKIRYKASDNLENIYARLVFVNENLTPIGMANSKSSLSFAVGEGEIDISFDTKNLAADKYMLRMSLYEINKYGMHNYVSVYNHLTVFSLNDKPSIHNGMNWEKQSWGNMCLDSFDTEVH